jgi:hypothetical protein
MAAHAIFGVKLDEFQKVRLKQYVWIPRVLDSSGFSSFKTFTFWMAWNLRSILIEDNHSAVYYQNFNAGQQSFWQYYDKFRRSAPFFNAQIGRMNLEMTSTEGRATNKGASCWKAFYRNGSQIYLPAPGFLQNNSASQASLRFNNIGIDEFTKAEATGSKGIDEQIMGRGTREAWNKHHPFWCNHQLFLATAEGTEHPAYERYQMFKRQVDAGNPEYALISFCFKDISDLPSQSGKTFKEALREDRVLSDMKQKQTKQRYLQEVLGCWSRSGKSWYSSDALDACVRRGREIGLRPLLSRAEDTKDHDKVYYFLGADIAKGEGKKSDDGALVVLRAEPKGEAQENVGDWDLRFVWAYRIRKADVGQWSGHIHWKDRAFKFTGICMDPGGGGIWIKDELAKEKQQFGDVQFTATPIITPDNNTVMRSNPCLCMFGHGDDTILKKYEDIKGMDNLTDAAHCEMQEVISRAIVAFPPPFYEIPREEREDWSQEKQDAANLLDTIRKQLLGIYVLTDEAGKAIYTKHNARTFGSKGKKDFAYAAMMALVRFLVWLKIHHDGYEVPEDELAMGE